MLIWVHTEIKVFNYPIINQSNTLYDFLNLVLTNLDFFVLCVWFCLSLQVVLTEVIAQPCLYLLLSPPPLCRKPVLSVLSDSHSLCLQLCNSVALTVLCFVLVFPENFYPRSVSFLISSGQSPLFSFHTIF